MRFSENKKLNDYVIRNNKYNFTCNVIDGAAFSLGMIFIAFNTIFPVFIKKVGGTSFLISLIPFITIACTSVPQLFAAHLTKNLRRKKPINIIIGLFQRIPWLVVGVSCIIFGNSMPSVLMVIVILMYIIYSLATGVSGPVWFDMISKITPIHIRGRLLSTRSVIGQLLGIIGSVFAGRIIKNISYPYNYSILFFIASFFLFVSFASFCSLREPEDDIKKDNDNFYSFIKKVPDVLRRNRDFRYFVISRSFFELGVSMIAFYSVFGIKKFNLSDSYAGIFTTVTAVAYVLGNFILGFLGDKKGHKINILIGELVTMVAAIMAVIFSNIYLFYAVFVFASIGQSARDISTSNITVEFCRPYERVLYIAISSVVMIPISIIVLIMGSLADVFGYEYLFIITAISSAISLIIMYFKVKDPRHNKQGAINR
ncbi:MFS transporter [Clostridium oryzae]|uniref:Major facilitator superfamily protein n=1 Tax=Clostridium oryzae TaxID=1450648 RepID=A0A1V4IX94_9CLOT|nr:MFS transporter [Clostridium oryzae]OPJ64661.1 major facilitator superfamily protein [Clostridium oryzae]